MKHRKTAAICFAAVSLLMHTGCGNVLQQNPQPDSSIRTESVFPRYDINGLKSRIEALQKIWKEKGRDEEITAEIQAIIHADDEAYAIAKKTEITYYADWTNELLFDAYTTTRDDFSVVDEMITWCFAQGYKYSSYPHCFESYIDESWISYYLVNSLNRIMSNARKSSSENGEKLDEYYDLAYDNEEDPDALNLNAAEMYLDLLKDYDLTDSLYNLYNRDYTVEQASETAADVLLNIVPLKEKLSESITDDPMYEKILAGTGPEIDAYLLLKEYGPRISAGTAESVNKLFSEELYKAASGKECYDGSYTVSLSGEQSAYMYTFLCHDYYDLITVTHEFGHFHSDWRDQTPVYIQTNNVDLAESQSQSMEMLFTAYYDEIYKDDAPLFEKLALLNLLDSVTAGLAVGEFEYRVMQNADSWTPEDVVECYSDLNEQYNIGTELYQITHLFEQPGYYVSYGISALPAIQIYAVMQNDFDKAVEMYDCLSSFSSLSGETPFMEAMEIVGFRNPFDSDTMTYIAETISQRLDTLN